MKSSLDNTNGKRLPKPDKAIFRKGPNSLRNLENDDRKMEFVTSPFININEITQTVAEMRALISNIPESTHDKIFKARKANGWKLNLSFNMDEPNFEAAVQSIESLTLDKVQSMLQEQLPSYKWGTVNNRALKLAKNFAKGRCRSGGVSANPRYSRHSYLAERYRSAAF